MKTVVCFAAHPDDLEFSCTGLLYKLLGQGYEAVYVIATNGENGFKDEATPPAERVRIREREQRAAARALGVTKVVFLGHRDGFLRYTETLRSELVQVLRRHRPEIVCSFDPANRTFENLNLFHRDHRVIAEAVFDACFAARNRFMYPGEPHRVERLYLYGSDRPDHFEDITDFIDRKVELLRLHASQFPDFSRVEHYIREVHSRRTERFRHSEPYRVIDVQPII